MRYVFKLWHIATVPEVGNPNFAVQTETIFMKNKFSWDSGSKSQFCVFPEL